MSEKSKQQGKPSKSKPFSSAFVMVEQAQNMNRQLDQLLAKKHLTPQGLPMVRAPEPSEH